MIRVRLYNIQTGESSTGDEKLLENLQLRPDIFIWADFNAAEPAHEKMLMMTVFGISPDVIDDAQRERHPPKLEWFDDHFFLLLKAFDAQTDSIEYGVVQASFFVGDQFIVTRRAKKALSFGAVWDEVEQGRIDFSLGPTHICYQIVKHIIDRYTPIVLGMENKLELMEDGIFDHAGDKLLESLMGYNTQLKKLRRIFVYQQTLMAELSTAPSPMISKTARQEFRNAHEHMERLSSLSQLYQELAVDLMEGYLSLSSHRLNEIMKVLTIAAVIFLPLTFLAGIYGMNFVNMPELNSKSGYFVVLAVMLVMVTGLLMLFRKLKWI